MTRHFIPVLILVALIGCNAEDALRATGADVRLAWQESFDHQPTVEEFEGAARSLHPCRSTPPPLRLVAFATHIRVAPALIQLPADMTVYPELTHADASWWQTPTGETIAFVHSDGKGGWSVLLPDVEGVREDAPCRERVGERTGVRKQFVVPAQPAGSFRYVNTGTLLFRRGVGVQWVAQGASPEGLQRMMSIIQTIRELP